MSKNKQKKKRKLNPHLVLSDFHRAPNFPQIGRAAGQWVKDNPNGTEEELLIWAHANYEAVPLLTLNQSPADFAIFGEVGNHIPQNAVRQMEKVMRLPNATRGAMMPDAHLGYAMPIGGVAELEDAISPSFVGYDISCMVQLSVFDISPQAFSIERKQLAEVLRGVTSFGLGSDFDPGERQHAVMEDPLWDEISILSSLKSKADEQLGSSGGGNHFADLVVIEYLEDADPFKAGEQKVGLLTHSGSRGTGHKTATYYVKLAEKEIHSKARGIPKGYEWLDMQSELGQEYFAAMQVMGAYARANHDLIHDHFRQAAGLSELARVWNRHNYAWVDENGSVLHRKGATPAEPGQPGLIPGTSGTASYLVRGLGNQDSLASSSHGAGRYFSRTEAYKRHDEKAFRKHMRNRDILHFGLNPDETLFAYKDIEMVIGLQAGVLVEPVARMTPKVVIMGGKSDDGD